MAVEFLSIVIFAFSVVLFSLGVFTWWIERQPRRTLGLLMMLSALAIAAGYAFLGSRFSIAIFGRLIITIDLPHLMTVAIIHTVGILLGFALAGSVFLWITGRLVRPTQLERKLATFTVIVLAIALIISLAAAWISR